MMNVLMIILPLIASFGLAEGCGRHIPAPKFHISVTAKEGETASLQVPTKWRPRLYGGFAWLKWALDDVPKDLIERRYFCFPNDVWCRWATYKYYVGNNPMVYMSHRDSHVSDQDFEKAYEEYKRVGYHKKEGTSALIDVIQLFSIRWGNVTRKVSDERFQIRNENMFEMLINDVGPEDEAVYEVGLYIPGEQPSNPSEVKFGLISLQVQGCRLPSCDNAVLRRTVKVKSGQKAKIRGVGSRSRKPMRAQGDPNTGFGWYLWKPDNATTIDEHAVGCYFGNEVNCGKSKPELIVDAYANSTSPNILISDPRLEVKHIHQLWIDNVTAEDSGTYILAYRAGDGYYVTPHCVSQFYHLKVME